MANFLNKIFSSLFGNKNEKERKALQPLIDEINAKYETLKSLSNDELRNKSNEFRTIIKESLAEIDAQISDLQNTAEVHEDLNEKDKIYRNIDELRKSRDSQIEVVLNEILTEAFAVVKETAYRFTNNPTIKVKATELDRYLAVSNKAIVIDGDYAIYHNQWEAAGNIVHWNMVHYDVQLIGGIVLHQGKIAEMATGEGKTLVATLPAYLNALAGEGVHIVTVNDYLARRDSEWNGVLFNFLGLRVDCIDKHQPNSAERKFAYMADITYGTNNEFGFDYLRDNMVHNPDEMVQRKHHYAMVDEVDSVLIDDARTPLIISGQIPNSQDDIQFYEMKPRIQKLVEAQRKVTNQFLTDAKNLIKSGNTGSKEGEGGLALYRSFRGNPKNSALIKFLNEPGMQQVLRETENFYLQDQQKNMPQVDKELFYHIDEKNNSVELVEKGIELLTGAGEDTNFFIIPEVGSEIADIERSSLSAEEKLHKKDILMQEFGIKSERIHTVTQLLKAYSLFDKDIDYVVMDGKVKIVDENTGRILEGRRYSDGLHQAIEAKENVKVEAASQTMATITLQNYFRMYHKLCGMTGTAETEAQELWDIYKLEVSSIPTNKDPQRTDKEDLIYKTKREKYNAIIEEISRLTAADRPVLVGTTNVEVSELLSRMLTQRKIKHNVLNAKQHKREADIVAEAGKAGAVTIATNMAGRGTDIKLDDITKNAGGLAIIGSERHDSRRVDRQLRGRSGRQGDPGSTQFYVSLDDELMRLFGSERIAKVMDTLGYKEGEEIQHSMITKSIERAQKKVEENNFGIRKRLLEYDDVMNKQREVIYGKRKHALFGERIALDIQHSIYDLCDEIVHDFVETKNYEGFRLEVIRYFSTDTTISENEFSKGNTATLTDILFEEVMQTYHKKQEEYKANMYPILKGMYENMQPAPRFVVADYANAKHDVRIFFPLEETIKNEGRDIWQHFEKSISLSLIDDAWKEHLRAMDDLKQEVQTAHFEQKDPLVIYKIESFNLFKHLISTINREVSTLLFKGGLKTEEQVKEGQIEKTDMKGMKASKDEIAAGTADSLPESEIPQQQPVEKKEPIRVGPKIGRNDPCPCGSGKKFKNCHGA